MRIKLHFGIFLYFLLSYFDKNIGYAAQNAEDTAGTNINIITNLFSTETLLNVVFAIVIFIMTILLSKVIPGIIASRIEKHIGSIGGNAEEMVSVVSRTLSVLIFLIGLSASLTVLGVDMSIFMGGIGFGIGFTLRVFLTNFITGIIIVTQGNYHAGDLIEIGGKMGTIKKIYSLYTAVEQFNGVIYFIPNVKFLEENVSNYYSNDKRRIEIEVMVDYETDVYKAKQIMMQVATQFPNILKAPETDVLVEKLGQDGVLLTLRTWITSDGEYITTKSNISETINLAFKKSDIKIPGKHISLKDTK